MDPHKKFVPHARTFEESNFSCRSTIVLQSACANRALAYSIVPLSAVWYHILGPPNNFLSFRRLRSNIAKKLQADAVVWRFIIPRYSIDTLPSYVLRRAILCGSDNPKPESSRCLSVFRRLTSSLITSGQGSRAALLVLG